MTKRERAIGKFFEQDSPRPLNDQRAVGDQILEALRMAILKMDIAPGSMVAEEDIGRRFQASRTPVREALLQLRTAGLVVTRVGRGNFVTKLSESQIREAQFIREVIEVGIAEHICKNGLSVASKIAITSILERQMKAIETNNTENFSSLDDAFHLALAQATGFGRIANILEREKMALDRLRTLSLDDPSHMETLYDQHQQIFSALCAQDTATALMVLHAHLSSVLDTLSDLSARHKECFE